MLHVLRGDIHSLVPSVLYLMIFIHVQYILFIQHGTHFIAGSLELAYSLIWGSHKIWGKGGGDTLDLI